MAESISIKNNYVAYIKNEPYNYPTNNASATLINSHTSGGTLVNYNTGWHIFPGMLWKHFCKPKDWYEMCINYEAYRVDGIKISAFNMIPLTTQLAIQGNTIFTAFNNCIYAIGYQDKLYETQWHNWYVETSTNYNPNLMYHEGLFKPPENSGSRRYELPIYVWQPTNVYGINQWTWNDYFLNGSLDSRHTDGVYPSLGYVPTGALWDPFNRPDELKELRPGKNAIGFSWERHECDANKWFNIDQIASWWPYTAAGPYNIAGHPRPGEYVTTGIQDPNEIALRNTLNPPINDYSVANWSNTPVVPMQWWWKEMQTQIAPINITSGSISDAFLKHMNLFFNGTEAECYKYGPTQCFIKMMPIIDSNNTNIECAAQICIRTELLLSVKKRRSAFYAPTWGPLPWRAVYSGRSSDLNFMNTYVRYRTGGMRRAWQNIGDSSDQTSHPRRTPYNTASTVPAGTGQGSTITTGPTYTYAKAKMKTVGGTRVTPSAPPMPPAYEESEMLDPVYPPTDQFRV